MHLDFENQCANFIEICMINKINFKLVFNRKKSMYSKPLSPGHPTNQDNIKKERAKSRPSTYNSAEFKISLSKEINNKDTIHTVKGKAKTFLPEGDNRIIRVYGTKG